VRHLRLLERLVNKHPRRCVLHSEGLSRELEHDDRVYEALLCAVVQVTDHAAALLVSGGGNAGLRSVLGSPARRQEAERAPPAAEPSSRCGGTREQIRGG
jgi:hypothetical protein